MPRRQHGGRPVTHCVRRLGRRKSHRPALGSGSADLVFRSGDTLTVSARPGPGSSLLARSRNVRAKRPTSGSAGCSRHPPHRKSGRKRSSRSSTNSIVASRWSRSLEEREQMAEFNLDRRQRAREQHCVRSGTNHLGGGSNGLCLKMPGKGAIASVFAIEMQSRRMRIPDRRLGCSRGATLDALPCGAANLVDKI